MIYFSKSTGGFYDDDIHTSIPADAVEVDPDDHQALIEAQAQGKSIEADANGKPFAADPPPPSQSQQIAMLTAAVQAHLDTQARAMQYDSIYTACTYADEPAVPKFQTEGQALRAWRSNVWSACYQVLDAVAAGTQQMPTSADLISQLPAFSM